MHTLKIKILAPLLIFRHFETIIPFVSVTPHVVGNFYPLRISSPKGEKFPHRGVKLTPIFGVIITHRSITPLKLVYLPLRWGKFYSLKFTVYRLSFSENMRFKKSGWNSIFEYMIRFPSRCYLRLLPDTICGLRWTNRDLFPLYCLYNLIYIRGDFYICLLGFWPSGAKTLRGQ